MAAKKQHDADKFELIISAGLDIDKRRIYFGDVNIPDESEMSGEEVSWKTTELAIRNLHILENISSDPIEIHLSSFGGSLYSMLRFADAIQASPCKMIFVGGGMIMSAGAFIMCVCDERFLYSHSTVMVHHGSNSNSGNAVDMKIEQEHYDKLLDQNCEMLAQNSFMSKSFWNNVMRHDIYLTAQEAKSCGLCEHIIEAPDRSSVKVRNQPDEIEVNDIKKKILKKVKLKS